MSLLAISIRNLIKRFHNTVVLEDINLDIPEGKVSCLIGPSGSGKSTLLRCLAFLEESSNGMITINGEALSFFEPPDGRREKLPPAHNRSVRAKQAWSSSSSTSGLT